MIRELKILELMQEILMIEGIIQVSKKQCGSVSLMEHVLEACDLDTYAYTHGQIEWENGIVAY